jgi:hypothetical protein
VSPFPVIEDDRVRVVVVTEMTIELELGWAAAEVFDGRVDEPDAKVILGARPAIGVGLVLYSGVTVLVLN